MSAGAWFIAASFTAVAVLFASLCILCARDSRRASGKASLYRRLRARLTGRRVPVPGLAVDGKPLTLSEMSEFAWLKLMHNHGAEASEAAYGKTDGGAE